jgi:hypothetical protein
MARPVNVYGDGRASGRIADALGVPARDYASREFEVEALGRPA